MEILLLVDRKYLNAWFAWGMFTIVGEYTYEPNMLAANAKLGRDSVPKYSKLLTTVR